MDGRRELGWSPGQELRRGAGLEPLGMGWKEEAENWGWVGRKKLRTRDGGDVLGWKSGGRQHRVGRKEQRVKPVLAEPPMSHRMQGSREQGMDVEAMHAPGWGFGTSELGEAGSRVLLRSPPPRRVPLPHQPAQGSQHGPVCAARRRQREVLKDGAKPSGCRVKIGAGRERCQFITTASTRGGRTRRLHTSSPLPRGD